MSIIIDDNAGWWFSCGCQEEILLYWFVGLALRGETCGEFIKKERRKMKQGKVKSYRYGMKREFTLNNHPKEGLFACLEGEVLEEHDDIFVGYVSVLFYDRELTDEECERYKLEKIE